MFDRASYGFDVEVIVEALEALVDELSATVEYDCIRHSEPTHNVFPYEVLDVLGRYGDEGLGLYPFCEVVHNDQQVFCLAFAR